MTSTTEAPAAERFLEGSGGRRWRVRAEPDLSAFDGGEWPRLISLLLAHRGVGGFEQARDYFADPEELTDPSLMPDLDVAVERLARACVEGETVAVLGDFDVDGVTATTVLVEGLQQLGAQPLPYIPHRFTEGYGPNVNAIRKLRSDGATLLVTADCGTSSVVEVDEANELGMEVIVIDHHSLPEQLPDALALVNPKHHGSEYGSEPAAVGVAYKVVHELHDRLDRPYDPEPHRALVALGSICDLAPMLAENRDLVRLGLRSLARTDRPGLVALAEEARADIRDVDVEMCGWVLGPRLNAAGRMDHAQLALDLLLAGSREEAQRLAKKLEELNRRRRDDTAAAMELVGELMTAEERAAPLLFVASPQISAGIVGLVASRLAEQHHRPAIVMELAGGEGRASCRSIEGFDITGLLRRHVDLFRRFGGHRAAAGFTIDGARLDEVRSTLVADAADQLDPATLVPTITVDAELPLHDVNGDLLRWLRRLGPHGVGNPTPTFLAPSVRVQESREVGADGAHLQFTLREGRVTWRAIAFGNAEHAVPDGQLADIVYTFRRDNLHNTIQLEVLDLRAAG
jgi:single-stranded-DNA-specific exonuclease